MNKEINLAQNIANLRKKNNVSQGQLAKAINVTPQAISKWENGICQPDTSSLPLLADFFNVSIDYLFYGYEEASDDIYEKITKRVASMPADSDEIFEDAVKLSTAAQHGIMDSLDSYSRRNQTIIAPCPIFDEPLHLMSFGGLSIRSPKGFSAILTKNFINSINGKTMKRAGKIFGALADEDCLRVTMEILNFQGISRLELMNKTQFDEQRLINAIEKGKKEGFIKERQSKHPILVSEYFIQRHHFNCFLLLLSTIKMIEMSLRGASRYMLIPRLSMSFDCDEEEKVADTDENTSEETKSEQEFE